MTNNNNNEKPNLWLLTEERPKPSVINQIVALYCRDFNDNYNVNQQIKIKPQIVNKCFLFTYEVEGISIEGVDKIYIKTVSGSSSFTDFLVYKQKDEPNELTDSENLLMAIEETKTSDEESRNTGVYQRGSKFIYINAFYSNVRLYMLYNEELGGDVDKEPTDTSKFGTNILLTLGVDIVGKNIDRWFRAFNSLEDLITFKSQMKKGPSHNVPITITKTENKIYISGRLAKPKDAGNIGHDPNIGALSMIGGCIRKLGWNGEIIFTNHGTNQSYINRTGGNNKFLYNCKIIDAKMEGIVMPNITLPNSYWHYEKKSEKIASILLHVNCLYHNIFGVYENHAGCERGYFKDIHENLITLPKKDRNDINLFLPDVVLYNKDKQHVLLVEGKKLSTLNRGLIEIQNYDSIEIEYIYPIFGNVNITRCLSIYGGNQNTIPNEFVLIYVNESGKIYINENAPDYIKEMF